MTTERDTDARTGSMERRSTVGLGLLMIVLGAAFLAARAAGVDIGEVGWPLFPIVAGIVLFAFSFSIGGQAGAGPAIGGAIATTAGLVLSFQNATGLWATWAYAWALVAPGGAGLGLLIYGLVTRQHDFVEGGRAMFLVGLGLFAAFAFFFEGIIGLSGDRLIPFDAILPGVLVVIGGILIVSSLFGRTRRDG